jgi:hypothetical protein
MKGSVRAVVAGTGDSLPDFCRRLMAAGLDPNLRLDVYRDGVPSFGVKSLHAGQFEHAFDEILLTQESNNMRSRNGRDQDPDVPHLGEAHAPLPRGNVPPFETPTASGLDADIGSEIIPHILKLCAENGISTDVPLGDALEELSDRIAAAGDAGPSRQHLVDDEEPLDDEVIERVMQHAKAKLSPSAAQGLEDLLRSAPGADDDLPAPLRGTKEGERLREYLDGKDRHSFSDRVEAADAIGEAIELMRPRGGLDPGTGPRMAERRGTEPWHPGRGEPAAAGSPRAAGVSRPPGSLVPATSRPKPFTASDKRMASDAALKSFAKLCGVKKKHLPRSI